MNQDNNFTLENFEKLKNGDKYSFNLLYKEYNLILYRTALLLLGNKDDAEDVLQDTFLSIYKNINSLKDFNKLKPWIFSILKNFCYTKYKKRKREFPDEFVLDRADIGSVSNGEDEFLLNEVGEKVILFVDKYPETSKPISEQPYNEMRDINEVPVYYSRVENLFLADEKDATPEELERSKKDPFFNLAIGSEERIEEVTKNLIFQYRSIQYSLLAGEKMDVNEYYEMAREIIKYK
ncbi:RNA polymerase sigma factor [Peptoniphilus porci]|uniref:RNA polymerase sigma factor n=1 Tax=Peptoniphilus porci TaxID=2652280 RepID=UPI0009FB5D86|nr:sigma factor [Peptoniphilus porci]